MNWMAAVSLIAAYLIGSFPTAFLVGKANGIDLRTVGSGNLGATNVLRTIGWRAGLLVYVVDMIKGVIPVVALSVIAGVARGGPWGIGFGIAAIAGHVRPIFLLGRGGGKGVATASGVFLALAPIAAAVAFVAFVITVSVTKYVSLGSLAGSVALVVTVWLQERAITPLFVVSATIALFVFYTHRANIQRLRVGTENRISRARTAATTSVVAETVDKSVSARE